MPREGYTNVSPTQERAEWFRVICDHLALDPESHAGRLDAIDFALRRMAQRLGKEIEVAVTVMYTSIQHPNDTLTVVLEENGVPVEQMSFLRRGNKVMLHGHWTTHDEAVKYATGCLTGKIKP